jgi:hypothetical protein
MITLTDLFNLQILKTLDLIEHEEELQDILKNNEQDVIKLSQMEESQIHDNSLEISGFADKTPEFEFYKKNLLYIKQMYFINASDKKVETINMQVIKELRLEEILEEISFERKDTIEISVEQLKNLANKKNEVIEQWNEYNIITTMSQKLDIPESNIMFISSLSEYISFVSSLKTAEEYVSRGQKDCTYELLPSLHRSHRNDYSIHLSAYEGAFKQKIIYYDKDILNRSNEALRAEGQHFGLPTDYLDFTEAHLISLLFAIEDYEYDSQHSVVYFINAIKYNGESVGQNEKLLDYSIPAVVESINSKYSNSRSYFIKLGNSNERIHFQKGCFLKVSTEDKDASNARLKKYCKVIVINKNCKKEILKELFNLGITFENIYPDKDNVVKSIKFHYKEIVGRQA